MYLLKTIVLFICIYDFPGLLIRRSLQELESNPDFAQEKNDFLKAWKRIKELPPSNPNSFWSIASYHGMPFKKRTVPPLNPPKDYGKVWGGYCQHNNVLFPLWHRYYCLRLEQALQTVAPGTALHYWDQTFVENPIPNLLTQKTVFIDGVNITNPLLHFNLTRGIDGEADSFYIKTLPYTTRRYPYSGIQNPPEAKKIADGHNVKIDGMNVSPEQMFKENLTAWLTEGSIVNGVVQGNSVLALYQNMLENPDYNTFSNTQSAGQSVEDNIEQAHNEVHLAVGGYSKPEVSENGTIYYGFIEGANGDMGANEVAAFDPVFFLHHANVDRMFWMWQKKWGKIDEITIREDPKDKGVTPAAGQGPSVDQTKDQILSMDTPMPPFQDEYGVIRNGKGCINIETQLGYTYSIGSLDKKKWEVPRFKNRRKVSYVLKTKTNLEDLDELVGGELGTLKDDPLIILVDFTDLIGKIDHNKSAHFQGDKPLFKLEARHWKRSFHLSVEGIKRDTYPGSLMVHVLRKSTGIWKSVGLKSILDHWDRTDCVNCQVHRLATVHMKIPFDSKVTTDDYKVHIVYKDPHRMTKKNVINELDLCEKMEGSPRVRFFLKSEELR